MWSFDWTAFTLWNTFRADLDLFEGKIGPIRFHFLGIGVPDATFDAAHHRINHLRQPALAVFEEQNRL